MKIRRLIEILVCGLWTTAAIGCAGNLPETRHGQAAGEWQVHLPSTPSPFGKLAFGSGGNAQPAPASETDELLAVKHAAPKKPAPQRVKHVAAPTSAPVVVANAQPELPAEAAKPLAAPTLLASNEPSAEQRYGQRETQARKLEEFRGGDAIVISAGALVIVLLIVILVLLLR